MLTKAFETKTYDTNKNENGWLMELEKDGELTKTYLTVASPGAFKGYHLHRVRESNYVCVKGEVTVILYDPAMDEIHRHNMKPGDKLNIPNNIPTGLENNGTEDGWLINSPDPPYDPNLKGEQVDFNQEEVEAWFAEQKALLNAKLEWRNKPSTTGYYYVCKTDGVEIDLHPIYVFDNYEGWFIEYIGRNEAGEHTLIKTAVNDLMQFAGPMPEMPEIPEMPDD